MGKSGEVKRFSFSELFDAQLEGDFPEVPQDAGPAFSSYRADKAF